MDGKQKTLFKFLLISLLPIGVFFISLFMGRYPVSPHEVVEVISSSLLHHPISDAMLDKSIVIGIRVPRTLLAMLIGAGLSLSGAACQGMFKNPLVSQDIIGVSTGAGFGAVMGILISSSGAFISFCAFIFGILSVILVLIMGRVNKTRPILTLILSGIIVSSIFSALISLVKYLADPYDKLPTIIYWLMGSFAKASYEDIKLIFIPVVGGMILLLLVRWRINILSLGDEEAHSLGEKPDQLRWLIIAAVTVITASAVTVAGIIAWVGLVIPHISRMIVGVDHKFLFPASILIGSAFLGFIDIIARTISPAEIPIGILTAIIGAPFFAILFSRIKRGWI
ncbi:FecCD family ABC transporter permease [Methanospirillum sp.]